MSWKVANVRLELDEPEHVLSARLADRLGLAPDAISSYRILRKSLDARRHDDLHFIYAAEVPRMGPYSRLRERESSGSFPSNSTGPSPAPSRSSIVR
jgi:hypothetical protein